MILNDESGKFIGGLFGDGLETISDTITKGFVDGFLTIVSYILGFGFWFCKVGILVCVLLYICSHEQKSVSTAFKLGFIYLIIALVGSAI